MFHRARNHQGHTVGMRFHHDTDRLGLAHAGDGLDQGLDDVLHRVEVIVVEQNFVVRSVFTNGRSLLYRFDCHDYTKKLSKVYSSLM